MLPDRISNPGPPTYESGTLPIALCGLASAMEIRVKSMDHFTDSRALHSGIIYVLPIIGSHVLFVNKLIP